MTIQSQTVNRELIYVLTESPIHSKCNETHTKILIRRIVWLIFTFGYLQSVCNVVFSRFWSNRIECIVAAAFSNNALANSYAEYNKIQMELKKNSFWSNYIEKVSHKKSFNKHCCMCNEWAHSVRIMEKKKEMMGRKSVTKQTKRPFQCRAINQTKRMTQCWW